MLRSAFYPLTLIALLWSSAGTVQAQTQVSGRLVEARSGEPLAFACAVVKGTTHGVVADTAGRFTLTVQPGDTLLLTYVGFARHRLVGFSGEGGSVSLGDVAMVSMVRSMDTPEIPSRAVRTWRRIKRFRPWRPFRRRVVWCATCAGLAFSSLDDDACNITNEAGVSLYRWRKVTRDTLEINYGELLVSGPSGG